MKNFLDRVNWPVTIAVLAVFAVVAIAAEAPRQCTVTITQTVPGP